MKCYQCGTRDPERFYPYKPDRCKKCHAADVANVRHKNKRRAVDSKGGGCQVCGYNRCLDALVFHHTDPTTKSKKLRMRKTQHVYSVTGFVRTWDLIEKEIKKCVLVCKNCHSEIEAGLLKVEDFDPVAREKWNQIQQAIANVNAREAQLGE